MVAPTPAGADFAALKVPAADITAIPDLAQPALKVEAASPAGTSPTPLCMLISSFCRPFQLHLFGFR